MEYILVLLSRWSVRPRGFFFSSFAFVYTPRGHEAPQGHCVVTDDLRHRCHTGPRVLLALAIVSFCNVNCADSYEYISCTSSLSFSLLSTTSPPTTSMSSKASQVNSSSSSATATEACDLMQANVCRTTRRLVTCPFIDYIL
jgi:hypothetical protein